MNGYTAGTVKRLNEVKEGGNKFGTNGTHV